MNCEYCTEEIKPGENSPIKRMHRECAIRAVMGSAAHQLKECTCYGGDREDPPGMSLRGAAKLAAQTFDLIRVHMKN